MEGRGYGREEGKGWYERRRKGGGMMRHDVIRPVVSKLEGKQRDHGTYGKEWRRVVREERELGRWTRKKKRMAGESCACTSGRFQIST